MLLGNLNYLAVLAAAVASFVFGGLWYSLLSKHWVEATGQEPAAFKDGFWLYFLTFAAQVIMAWTLGSVLLHLSRGGAANGLWAGLVSALVIWFGFVVTTMTVNYAYHGARPKLTLIDGAHWLGVLLIQGAVLGVLGP
jgi:hypothetical protein